MPDLDSLDTLFVIFAFLFQIVLLVYFAIRKWAFDTAKQFGWIVYALCLPAAILSIVLLLGGKPWYMWLAGFIYTIWAIFGLLVEYVLQVQWRNPIRWPIFLPYVLLYLTSLMLYWWPLGIIGRPLWTIYAALFIVSTVLNVTSHR